MVLGVVIKKTSGQSLLPIKLSRAPRGRVRQADYRATGMLWVSLEGRPSDQTIVDPLLCLERGQKLTGRCRDWQDQPAIIQHINKWTHYRDG